MVLYIIDSSVSFFEINRGGAEVEHCLVEIWIVE